MTFFYEINKNFETYLFFSFEQNLKHPSKESITGRTSIFRKCNSYAVCSVTLMLTKIYGRNKNLLYGAGIQGRQKWVAR